MSWIGHEIADFEQFDPVIQMKEEIAFHEKKVIKSKLRFENMNRRLILKGRRNWEMLS